MSLWKVCEIQEIDDKAWVGATSRTNPLHTTSALRPIYFCLRRSWKLEDASSHFLPKSSGIEEEKNVNPLPLSLIMISHIDLKSNCSEFVQCIEPLLIAELMRSLQAA